MSVAVDRLMARLDDHRRTLADVYQRPCSWEAARCADVLVQWLDGWHHFHGGAESIRRTDWSGPGVEYIHHGALASHDAADLTHLVCLAHDLAVRVQVSPAMRYLRVSLYGRRERGGLPQNRHPTLEQAMAAHRSAAEHGLTEHDLAELLARFKA